MGHGANPIPVAVVMGKHVYTGGINGANRETHQMPEDAAGQIAQCFDNIKAVITAAGGSMDDIVKIDCNLKDMSAREALNAEWIKHFPDETNRPVRKTGQANLAGAMLIQTE